MGQYYSHLNAGEREEIRCSGGACVCCRGGEYDAHYYNKEAI
jgi:hypothetical protein